MTSFSIRANSLEEHHTHATVKAAPRHLKPKHADHRHVARAATHRTLGGTLLAAAAALAVVTTVAMWAPTLGASPTVVHDSDAASGQAGAAAAVEPTLVPDAEHGGPIAGSVIPPSTAVQVTAARTFAGSQLASNAGLTLSAAARELLVGGLVDARSILSLGQYLAQTQLTVADFPASDTGTVAGGVRPRILVSGLAGVPLGTDASATDASATDASETDGAASRSAAASVEAWFAALSAPVNVESVVRTPSGVLVTFAPGEPSSMLPSSVPSQ